MIKNTLKDYSNPGCYGIFPCSINVRYIIFIRIALLNRNRQCFTFTMAPVSLISAVFSYWLSNKRKQTARLCPTYGY